MGDFANEFTELEVYCEAMAVAALIFVITKRFPREEAYALTDQLRRASRSIGAQIAEAWGKRRYPRHSISKLSDADSEQRETRHWIGVALARDYLRDEEVNELLGHLDRIGRMLTTMMKKVDDFRL